jgi:hypothetical protein
MDPLAKQWSTLFSKRREVPDERSLAEVRKPVNGEDGDDLENFLSYCSEYKDIISRYAKDEILKYYGKQLTENLDQEWLRDGQTQQMIAWIDDRKYSETDTGGEARTSQNWMPASKLLEWLKMPVSKYCRFHGRTSQLTKLVTQRFRHPTLPDADRRIT